jgi:plasmid stabilization system protein ParE
LRNIIFHPDVEEEIQAAYQWYQQQSEDLGEQFLTELESALQLVSLYPVLWPNFQLGFRRYLLPRFPYSVLYDSKGKMIFVVAVMHNHRHPKYWHKRL